VRYALISDIHANLPALEAVLAHIEDETRPDGIYHLGDLLGYAPWPDEVVALLQARAIPGVAGNYDSTVATDYKHCGCRYEDARQEELSHVSYEWTRAHCSEATRAYLGALPFRIDLRPLGGHTGAGPTLVLVHGTPTMNTLYWTEDRDDDFCRKMAARAGMQPGDVIAFGHTHLPWTRTIDEIAFVNTGSVGRPKDGDPRAGYALIDFADAGVRVTFERVAYDVEAAASAILDSDLPDAFAHYLRSGGRRLAPV
jgi:predicted phosphodiesterase